MSSTKQRLYRVQVWMRRSKGGPEICGSFYSESLPEANRRANERLESLVGRPEYVEGWTSAARCTVTENN